MGCRVMISWFPPYSYPMRRTPGSNHGQQKYDKNQTIAIVGQKAALRNTWLLVETPKCLSICGYTAYKKSTHHLLLLFFIKKKKKKLCQKFSAFSRVYYHISVYVFPPLLELFVFIYCLLFYYFHVHVQNKPNKIKSPLLWPIMWTIKLKYKLKSFAQP